MHLCIDVFFDGILILPSWANIILNSLHPMSVIQGNSNTSYCSIQSFCVQCVYTLIIFWRATKIAVFAEGIAVYEIPYTKEVKFWNVKHWLMLQFNLISKITYHWKFLSQRKLSLLLVSLSTNMCCLSSRSESLCWPLFVSHN